MPVEWVYTETGKTLAVSFPKADGDRKTHTVEELSESQPVLVQHTIQPEYSYEHYNRETYTRMQLHPVPQKTDCRMAAVRFLYTGSSFRINRAARSSPNTERDCTTGW